MIFCISLILNTELFAQDTIINKPVFVPNTNDFQSEIQHYIDLMNNWAVGDSLPAFLHNACLDYEFNEKHRFMHDYPSVRKQIISRVTNNCILNYIIDNHLFDNSCKKRSGVRPDYKQSVFYFVKERIGQ